MIVTAIVARGTNNAIGTNNNLPWHLPADLAFFKRKTLGRHVIMGRKCFDSIGQPLPKRVNIVITRDKFFVHEGVAVAHSIEEALLIAARNGETEAMILGGAQIYKQSMPYWHKLLLTEVEYAPEADVFFTEPDWNDFKEVWRESHLPDEKNKYAYTFREFVRISSPVSFLAHVK